MQHSAICDLPMMSYFSCIRVLLDTERLSDLLLNVVAEMCCFTEVVEFQESSDRRTGKPIAVAVIRAPLKTSCEIISEKPANGVVLAEAKAVKNRGVCLNCSCMWRGELNLVSIA